MAIQKNIKDILLELQDVLSNINSDQVDCFIKEIQVSKKIITYGAGRMGNITRCFSMRLSHLGMPSFFLLDSNVPAITKGDLLIISSGSGETQTVYDVAVLAKQYGARLSLVTCSPDSRIGKLSDVIIELKKNSLPPPCEFGESKQPLKSLIEQSLLILFDAIIMNMMRNDLISNDDMRRRHTNLE